jgi:3-hydroxyanthranilate 3,4-dioxygenase
MANLAESPPPTSERPFATSVQPPLDLNTWVEENRHLVKPPVSNRYLYDGRDFFVMVIKGPNARNDFHLVDSEEYFYQMKGDIKVRTREGGKIVDHLVHSEIGTDTKS